MKNFDKYLNSNFVQYFTKLHMQLYTISCVHLSCYGICYSSGGGLVDPTTYGLDLTKKYNTSGLLYGINSEATVKEIVSYLERTFCGSIALEVAHVQVSSVIDDVIR